MAGLADVKVGDLIYTMNTGPRWSGPWVSRNVYEVTRITPTQVIAGNRKFRKDSGRVIGDGYAIADPVTPEILEQHKAETLAYKRYHKAREIIERLAASIRKNELGEADSKALFDSFGKLLEEDK